MDEQGFRRFMKRAGKKDQVLEGLISQVRQFEAYLKGERDVDLGAANEQNLQGYAAALKADEARKRMRGLALYYTFTGNTALAAHASGMRQAEVAKARKPFALKDFRGVNPHDILRLKACGIVNAEQMLEAGRTPEARQSLANQSGVTIEAILELVKLSDLSRIEGVKAIRARLYYDAGVDTVEAMARWDPDDLLKMMAEYVERSGFNGIAPLPREVGSTIATARRLPKVVQY
jgi:predicted flap endonuclease-1-like 5' DNA nuclease